MRIPETLAEGRVTVRKDWRTGGVAGIELDSTPTIIVNPGLASALTQGQFDAVLVYTLGELATEVVARRFAQERALSQLPPGCNVECVRGV